ncbi:hypothetical protein F1559_001568 [Cyanidiococcus yangmingshanensis]|uniref:Sugar phosphate transporter domain-containing protein n=1 Tax=Cyanidiococcus yangmingshanensis TaxID=2690220 RepID=A0A7J7IGL0_9RHOD|nr:hypothetical protein F1559_001568 [Cyanidiococcus yangmingshanensis]
MKDGTVWRAILACMLYLIVSMFMIVLNKAVTRTNAGDATALLLLWQMSCTVVFLGALEHCQCLRLEPVRRSSLSRILPVTVFYVLNVGVSLLAIRHLNLTAYSAVKRLTPLCIVPLDRVLRGVVMTWSQLFACFVMVIGTLFMARFDVTSSWRAYLLGLASCICQATYMVLVKVRGSANEKSLSTTSMLKLNSVVAVPMLLPLVILSGQG